jgi:hypothetical protein
MRKIDRRVLWVELRGEHHAGGEQWLKMQWVHPHRPLRSVWPMIRFACSWQSPHRGCPVTDSLDALIPPKPRGKARPRLLVVLVDPDLTESPEPDTLYLTPREQYDGALMGYTRTPMDYWERTSNCVVAVYCRNCVEKAVGNLLGTKDKLEIAEFCDFNIAGAWVGEYTPEIRDGDWHRCS